MSRDVLKQVKESSIYPDHLMAEVARSTLLKTLVLSLVIHLVFVGGTSVRYIGLCFHYKTWQPDERIKKEKAEQEQKKLEDARQARLAKEQADAQKKNTPKPPAASSPASTGRAEASGAGGTPPAEREAGKEKSPIEKTLEEVSHERPKAPSATFDSIDDL